MHHKFSKTIKFFLLSKLFKINVYSINLLLVSRLNAMQIVQHLINKINTGAHILNKSRTYLTISYYFNCCAHIPRVLTNTSFCNNYTH